MEFEVRLRRKKTLDTGPYLLMRIRGVPSKVLTRGGSVLIFILFKTDMPDPELLIQLSG